MDVPRDNKWTNGIRPFPRARRGYATWTPLVSLDESGRTSHSIVAHTVGHDLVELIAATYALLATLEDTGPASPAAVTDRRDEPPAASSSS